jgi:hypothetical protein
VSYIVSHALAFRADAPSLTTVRAGQSITARLGSLVPGETYAVTAVGTCADGTLTPSSARVTFVASPPGCPTKGIVGADLFATSDYDQLG